jgi:hypothetical protein
MALVTTQVALIQVHVIMTAPLNAMTEVAHIRVARISQPAIMMSWLDVITVFAVTPGAMNSLPVILISPQVAAMVLVFTHRHSMIAIASV